MKTMWDEWKCQDAVCISILSRRLYQIRQEKAIHTCDETQRLTWRCAPSCQSHNSTHERIIVHMGRWLRLERGKLARWSELIVWHSSMQQTLMRLAHIALPAQKETMDVAWSLSLFNHVWFSSSATKGPSRCFSHRHVWVSCWCFLEIRSDFLGRPSAARLGRPTLPARGCSFTAVLTEAVICLAGRGCLLWVMPLQLVSATVFSSCPRAKDSGKTKNDPL